MNEACNMHGREAILMHRLCFDLRLAAARRGYYLNTYYDDVDHDGFDLIFDDQDYIKKTQVKTVESESATGQWSIHKRMLRPSFELIEKLGFEPSPVGEGTEGGIILMHFDASAADLAVKYFYTDLFVWLAFECEVIHRSDGRSQAAINRCLQDLRDGIGYERVDVPRALFLQAKGPDELLALIGLHSRVNTSWKHDLIQIANHVRPYARPEMPMSRPLPEVISMCNRELAALVLDTDL
jgi:hypothetical protein